MAGTVIADKLEAASTSTLVLKNGVADTPPTVQDSAGTEIGTFCRAWVNFNGTGTVAIRADFNVTSITDGGTGIYTVSFATAMPDANYSAIASSNLDQEIRVDTYATGSVRVVTDTAVTDASIVSVAIFR